MTGFMVSALNHALNHVQAQNRKTYSLPNGDLPIHQQADSSVGCTQECMESVIEYQYGDVVNLDKSSGADFRELSTSTTLKSYNLDVKRNVRNVYKVGGNMLKGNPSVITYDNNGVQHTVAINKITVTRIQGSSPQINIQVMNPLYSTYQTLPISSFNNGVIRTVYFNR